MIESTVDQEKFAIQGLLALKDCDSLNGSNKSASPQSFVTTPELNQISEITSVSNIFLDCANKPITFVSDENRILPKSAHYQQHSHLDKQSNYIPRSFNTQQIRQSNPCQVIRPISTENHVTLPSIQEMLSHHPSLYQNRQISSNTTIPIYLSNGFLEKYPLNVINLPYNSNSASMTSERLAKHNVYMEARNKKFEQFYHNKKVYLEESQLKNQHNQYVETKALLESHETNIYIKNIKTLSASELESFFVILKQYYRIEYAKEIKEQKEYRGKSESTEQNNNDSDETDIEDKDSDYRVSSDNSHDSNSNFVFINNNNKRTKIQNNKISRISIEKPRWTTEEKLRLLDAIIKFKSLDIMATFDWNVIGTDAGRTDKACKDQWRRGILKLFREYVSRL